MNHTTLIDFSTRASADAVQPIGAIFTKLPHALLITTQAGIVPEIAFIPPSSTTAPHWDLSRHTHLLVELENTGPLDLTAFCRVENPDADPAGRNCLFNIAASLPGGSGLRPGETGSILVELCRKKPPWIKLDVHGVIGRPWSDSPHDKPGLRCIDPANIVKIVLYGMNPETSHNFEVLRIAAVGQHSPPTEKLADPEKFFPFIDEFGQYLHADWPGKIHSQNELEQSRQSEAHDLAVHPRPATFNRFGGWKDGPTLPSTGWFRTQKHNGKWWLVDPDGNLFFSHGIDCVNWNEGATQIEERENYFQKLPAQTNPEFQSFYHRMTHPVHMGHYKDKTPLCYSFGNANLFRKYGPQWKTLFIDISHQRLASWGLNTIANWSEPAIYTQSKTPYTVNIRIGGKLLEGSSGYWGKFRDVFDPDFRTIRAAIPPQVQASSKDPWCLGYFVDNEISWGTDDISLAAAALASPPQQTAKNVFLQDLRQKYADISKLNHAWGTNHASWEALLQSQTPPDAKKAHPDLAPFHAKTADAYFRTIREAMQECVPHQLYLGCRFAWFNAPAVAAACRHCDVVSFNIYQRSVANFRLPIDADMPLMIGEWHLGALDRGLFHTGLCPVPDQDERALGYKQYVRGMLRHPQFVGAHWFKYMDELTTGRPSDEENFQIGFLSITDAPYPETIAAAREVGQELYQCRAGR